MRGRRDLGIGSEKQDLRIVEILGPSDHVDPGQKNLGLFSTLPTPISLDFLILPQCLVPLRVGAESTINLVASRFSVTWPSSSLAPHEDDRIHTPSGESSTAYATAFVLKELAYLPLRLVDGASFDEIRSPLLPLPSALDPGEALCLQIIVLKRDSLDWLP